MSKPKQKKMRKMTLTDMKSWLDGFCSAHDINWAPNAEQWTMIREMIMNIEETAPALAPVGRPVSTVVAPHYSPPQQQYNSQPAVNVVLPPDAPRPIASNVKNGQGKFKVPDIDTSDGNYESGFG